MVYPEIEAPLRERTIAALADHELAGNLRAAGASWGAGRARMGRDHGFAQMRERAREIRRDNIGRLPELLARLEERVRPPGAS